MKVSQLVEGLDQEVLLLSFAKKLDCLLVRINDHISEHALALSLRSNLVVVDLLYTIAALAKFFCLQVLSLDSELEIELAACLERLFGIVCISLDILK